MVREDERRGAGWEAQVLDRLRERLERAGDDAVEHAGWEAAATERLRAHFEAEN